MRIREFRVLEGSAEEEFDKYVEDWRRAYNNALQYWEEYQTCMARAGGDQAVMQLGKARSLLERIVGLIHG